MLVVSDIHFGGGAGSGTGRRAAALRRFIVNMAREWGDGLVVIPGDFTMRGRRDEYLEAERLIRELLLEGLTIACTPGNHDFGCLPGEKRINRDARRLYEEHVLRHVVGQPAVLASREYDLLLTQGRDAFLCLRSTHARIWQSNRIKTTQLDWANQAMRALPAGVRRRHLVTHRSLWRDEGDKHPAMAERQRLEGRLLAPYGFESFIHGHNHAGACGWRETPELGLRIFKVAAPTLATARAQGVNAFVGVLQWDPAKPHGILRHGYLEGTC